MSLEHSPAKQRRSINIQRQHYTADKQHYTADDLKVLTLKEWAKLTGISFQTASVP